MKHFQYIVIGNGLMGSAAARHLSSLSDSVAIIGPGEPADHSSHNGVFSSHYDQGRLTSKVGSDPIWGYMAYHAIQKYDEVAELSGIPFHGEVGRVWAKKPVGDDQASMMDSLAMAKQRDVLMQHFPAGDSSWREMFPYLDFPDEFDVLYEPAPAGYINPRQLIRAQNAIAVKQGATLIEQLVTDVQSTAVSVTVTTENGDTFTADKVLIATGAFTNFYNLLPSDLPLKRKTETMMWGTVSDETAVQLKEMPVVGYGIDDPDIDDIYMAPPLRYPDGTYKIKMGCNTSNELWPETLEEAQAWFQNGNSDADKPPMERALKSMLPEVNFLEITTHCCIVTYTPSGYPMIDKVPSDENGRIYIATGGNGSGAQGSDTLGRLAAGFMHDGRWVDDLPRQPFEATNEWGQSAQRLSKAQKRAQAKS